MAGSVCQDQDTGSAAERVLGSCGGLDTGRVPIDVDFTVVRRGYDMAAVDGIVQPYSQRPGIR